MKKITIKRNRNGDNQIFVITDENTVFWVFDFFSCGFSEEIDNIISIDPSGGPFVTKGTVINLSDEQEFFFEVETIKIIEKNLVKLKGTKI